MILLIAMNNLNAVFIKIMAKLEYSAEKWNFKSYSRLQLISEGSGNGWGV